MSMGVFNKVSHVNIHDVLKVAEVSVIAEVIVAICMSSPVIQYHLVLRSVKNSSFWDISHVW